MLRYPVEDEKIKQKINNILRAYLAIHLNSLNCEKTVIENMVSSPFKFLVR